METAALALSAATITAAYDAEARQFKPVVLQARVTNIGQINDQFNVDVLGIPADWFTRSVPGMRMRPGIDGTVDLTFQPPRRPESTAGPHSFHVRVTPQEQPDSYVEYGATLIVEPFVDTAMGLVEPTVTGEGEGVFRLRLYNGGNVPLTYALSALAGDGGPLSIQFMSNGRGEATTMLTVAPGQEATPELRVSAPPIDGIERPAGSYSFTVQATAVNTSGAWPQLAPPPLTTAGTLVLTPPEPVAVSIAPTRVELVDLLAREATATVHISNPSRRRIGVAIDARAPSAEYEIQLGADRVVLEPRSETEIDLLIRRSQLVPPTATPMRVPFQVAVRQIDLPADPDPSLLPAPIAAPGSVVVTTPPPIEVVIQPPGLKMDLSPRRRRGSSGRYKVSVVNQGNRRVRGYLDVQDPDNELDYIFGHQPKGLKRLLRRLFWRGAVPEAQRQVYSRMSTGATTVANAAGIQMTTNEPIEQDTTTVGRGMPIVLEPQATVDVPLEVRPGRTRLVGRSRIYHFKVTNSVHEQVLDGLTREAEFEHKPMPVLLLAIIALLLLSPLFIVIPLKLGCDRGTLEFAPYCVPPPITDAPPATVRQAGGTEGKTTVMLREGSQLLPVAEEPSAVLPGQFSKLVVPSPDSERVLYVTAKDELLSGATMMLADRNGNKSQLKTLEKGLWVAKPVWCQRQAGDPGRIAYVTASEPGTGRSGLQLRVLTLGGPEISDVLAVEGTTGAKGNGFAPDLFYGAHETPIQWWNNCQAIKYGEAGGDKRWLVDLGSDTPAVTEIRRFNLPGAQPVSAQATSATACEAKPFAQTDPAWAQRVIGAPGGPIIGAHGCTLTAAATVFKYYGVQTNPNQILGCAGEDADFFRWDEVAKKCASGKITNTVWQENPTYQDISNAIQARQPAIIGLTGGPTGSHYVVVAGGSGDAGGDFRIFDPWDGTSYKRLSDYLQTGSYRLKYLVRYEGTAPVCGVQAGNEPSPVKFSGIEDGASAQGPVRVQFEVPSGAQHTATHASGTTFDKDGFYSVGVALADGTYRSLSFFVDREAPKTTAAWQPDKEQKDKFAGLLTLTAKDSVTPVAVTRFSVDGKDWQDYTGDRNMLGNTTTRGIPLAFEEVGEHRVRMYSIDAAGNKENETEHVIMIEGVPPTPRLTPGGQLNFGLTEVQKVVNLAVDGPGILRWKATPQAEGGWLTVEPAEGVIRSGEQQKLTIRIDRDKVNPGDFVGSITVSSQVGQTDVSTSVEVLGKQTAPAANPTPATAAATPIPQGGRGAGVGDEEPVAEPDALTIRAVDLTGSFTVREKANVRMEWYVAEMPDWLGLEVEGFDVLPNQRVLTNANSQTEVRVRPDWSQISAGETREGVIVIRDSSNRHEAHMTITVTK